MYYQEVYLQGMFNILYYIMHACRGEGEKTALCVGGSVDPLQQWA